MKFNSKEEEDAHFNAVFKGTAIGGVIGLTFGMGSIYAASRRYPVLRTLRLPAKAFLLTSTTSFGAIFYAEQLSNDLHKARDPMRTYQDGSQRATQMIRANETNYERFMEWGRENRYRIVVTSWLASMVIALAAVNRSPVSKAQKLVQARVYAQALTLAVLIASAAFEVSDARNGRSRWETITTVDPTDPEHKRLISKTIHKEEYAGQDLWMDMVEAEERRLAKAAAAKQEATPSIQ